MITGPRSIMPKLKLFYAVLVVAGLGFALVSPAAADYRTGLLAAKKQDYATAFREFRTLALKGHAPSQFNIALMYHHGRGVPQDYDKARQWYPLSAERGHISAMHNQGSMYRRGAGLAADRRRTGRVRPRHVIKRRFGTCRQDRPPPLLLHGCGVAGDGGRR